MFFLFFFSSRDAVMGFDGLNTKQKMKKIGREGEGKMMIMIWSIDTMMMRNITITIIISGGSTDSDDH